jgi:CubicO group peptidase (beta-lactamase class C family)
VIDRLSSILKHFPVFILPLLLFGLCPGCGSDSAFPNYTATIAEAKAAAAEAKAECDASAITLVLVDGKGVIWTESRGDADRAAGKVADPETMFGIGSVSKMLATIAVMQLVEKGDVLLEEPLTTYLKQFSMASPEYRNIKVRMLLNHSAGFPGGDTRNAFSEAPVTGYAAQVMDGLKYQRLKHAPGYLNVYSNDGFTMVENLVKEVSGVSYPAYVRRYILAPLEMTHSRYMDDYLPDGSYAKTYTGETVHPYTSLNLYATGGLYSSAADMAKLMMMFINKGAQGGKQILSPGSIVAMSQDQTVGTFNPSPSDLIRYGLGWDTVTQPGLKAVGISGWQKGGSINGLYGAMFRSVMIIAPEANLGVAVMIASNKISSDAIQKAGERVLLRALVDRGALREVPASLTRNPLPVVSPSAEEKNAFSGSYAASGALYWLSFAADGFLTVDSYGENGWIPLYQRFKKRSDGWYAADGDSITALRLLTASGRGYIEIRKLAGAGHYTTTNLMAQQLAARGDVSSVWQARQGIRWLPVNEDSLASFLDLPISPGLMLTAVDGLTGYLFKDLKVLRDMDPQMDVRLDGMFLQIPQIMGRDLVDAAIERRAESDWLRVGSTLYRPQTGIPVSGSISINNATAWRLYDGNFNQKASGAGSGSAVLPGPGGAAYLLLFGSPGVTINLRY